MAYIDYMDPDVLCSQKRPINLISLSLGSISQQAINWTSVDQDLQCHMVSLSHNALNSYIIEQM